MIATDISSSSEPSVTRPAPRASAVIMFLDVNVFRLVQVVEDSLDPSQIHWVDFIQRN